MRLTDEDRERLFARLSAHAAHGALDLAELERRVAAVAAAQTHEQAAEVFADLGSLPDDPGAAAPASRGGGVRWGRGHGHADTPAAGWRATSERFRDPRSGHVMRVWEDAAGGRHYVPDDGTR